MRFIIQDKCFGEDMASDVAAIMASIQNAGVPCILASNMTYIIPCYVSPIMLSDVGSIETSDLLVLLHMV